MNEDKLTLSHVFLRLREIEKKLDKLLAKKDISNDERLSIMKEKFDAWAEVQENKMSTKARNWICEKEAAELLGGVKKETLRRRSKACKWPIRFTSVGARNYQYWKPDIERFLKDQSNRARF